MAGPLRSRRRPFSEEGFWSVLKRLLVGVTGEESVVWVEVRETRRSKPVVSRREGEGSTRVPIVGPYTFKGRLYVVRRRGSVSLE